MGQLTDEIRNRPLSRLAIPGSHNSFTYSLDKKSPVGPDEPGLMQSLAKIFGPLAKSIIYRWAVCQKLDGLAQLNLGVRYFDFRLSKVAAVKRSKNDKDKEIKILHALYGSPVVEIFKQIQSFLEDHPKEVVILDFQHFYGLDQVDLTSLRHLVLQYFQSKLCPFFQDVPSLTFLHSRGLQVIVICDYFNRFCNISWAWPRYSCPNPWANTTKASDLESFLIEGLTTRDIRRLFVSQAIFTLNLSTLLRNPFSSLEKRLARPCDKMIAKETLHQIRHNHLPLNILMIDYVEKCDIVTSVIDLNSNIDS